MAKVTGKFAFQFSDNRTLNYLHNKVLIYISQKIQELSLAETFQETQLHYVVA